MPAEGWWTVAVVMLAILVSRDFVIVRLRRLVRGESAPSTRDAVDAVEPALDWRARRQGLYDER